MTLAKVLLALILASVTSDIPVLKIEKWDVTDMEYTNKDGVTKKAPYLSVLVRNMTKDTVKVIQIDICKREDRIEGPIHIEGSCETAFLSGRFTPGGASWSNPLPVPADLQSIRLVRIQTVEAK